MTPDTENPSPTPAAEPGTAWFLDEGQLITELRRAQMVVDATPPLPNYADLREVQRGGQGVVYSATHTPTRRKVAVKVLHPTALTSANARRRFEREVELAAALRHPGVVRVYDSGTTTDGRLYLTMEWVEGDTLDEWAAKTNRDARAIAEMIAQVADALNHAHLHAVIHRDLKPSNIRLSADGTPTILDFGLATASTRDMTELTATGAFLGSLHWCSPEQALGRHAQIDTRTDIYSVGMLLYYLLTGVFPYDVKSDIRTALNNIAGAEPTPLRKLRPGVHEDLEVIAGKCLAKEPENRYQTAAELADDVRRHLAGEPIGARRASMWNAMRRQAARYRVLAWAGSLILVVSSASLLVVMKYAEQAALDRDRAQAATSQAENNLEFLQRMLLATDPETQENGRDVRVVSILDRAAATVDEELKGDPAGLADMHATIAATYSALGLSQQAEHHARRALHVAENSPQRGPEHPRTLEIEAGVYRVVVQQGRFQEAEPQLKYLIGRMDQSLGKSHKSTVLARNDLGECCRQTGRAADAEAWFREALASMPRGMDPEAASNIRNNLAAALHAQARDEEAENLYRAVIAAGARASGPLSRETARSQRKLGAMLLEQSRFEEAEPLLRSAYQASRQDRGEDHPITITCQHNLARAVEGLGRRDDAVQLWREVQERSVKSLGAEHVETREAARRLEDLMRPAAR